MSWRLRLACRVCLAVGIDDPEAWLDRVNPRTLALWEAFFRVEPWGFEAERSAGTNAMLSSLISMVGATAGVKVTPQPVEAFMPSNWIGGTKKPKPKRTDLRTAQKRIAQLFPTADKR